MTDHRLDGAAPSQVAPERRRHPAALTGDEDGRALYTVSARVWGIFKRRFWGDYERRLQLLLEDFPVDERRQLHQLVPHVDLVGQFTSIDFIKALKDA